MVRKDTQNVMNDASFTHTPSHKHTLAPLVALCLCLAIAAGAHAQNPAPATVISPDDLGVESLKRQDSKKRSAQVNRSVVRVKVTPHIPRHIRPIGDPAAYGAATLIQAEDGRELLITSEFLIRDAHKIELFAGDRSWPTQVLRADLHQGLALLSLPQELVTELTAVPLAVELKPGQKLFTAAHDARGETLVYPATLGPQGDGALGYYRQASPALTNGYPLMTLDGRLYGIFTFRPANDPSLGLAITAQKIVAFLDPKAEAEEPGDLKIEVLGTGGPRRQ